MTMLLSDLLSYARQRMGIVNNYAVEDAELTMYLNMSLGALYTLLCNDYEDYNLSEYLSTVSTGNLIPLPSDFLKLRGVDFGTTGQWYRLDIFGFQERNRYSNPISNLYAPFGNGALRKIRVMGDNILVEPEQLAAGQYRVFYTPKFAPLVNPTDALISAIDTNGFPEYAIADTGIKVYGKLNLPTAAFESEVARYEAMVRNGAKGRMNSGCQTMQNTRNQQRFGGGGLR